MNNEIQQFDFKGATMRTLTDEAGEPWFVAKDVCDILGTDTRDLHKILESDEITNVDSIHIAQNGGKAPLTISEPGLYRLVMKSRKPEAKEFQRWVTHEVLPSIRKHGAYMTQQTLDKALTSPDFLIQLATKLKEEQEKVKELEPKARFADAVAASDGTCLIGELAKMLRQNGLDIGQKPTVRTTPRRRIPWEDRLQQKRADPEGHGLGTVPNQGNRHHSFGRPRDYQPHRKMYWQRPDILRQPLLPKESTRLMETLKLIICTIILLGFVAAIMWVCDAWDTRVFLAYVATAIVADMVCVLLDD